MPDINNKISIDDLQGIQITKKFVKIDSSKYTEEAFNYILQLIDQEQSILFDEYTNRIYTLGNYYGGDTLKENLLYYSHILSIDINDQLIDEITAKVNSSALAFRGNDGIIINTSSTQDYDVIDIRYDLKSKLSNDTISINSKDYTLSIGNDDKLGISEYIKPKLLIDDSSLYYDDYNTDVIDKQFTLEIESSVKLEDFKEYEISGVDCEVLSYNDSSILVRIQHNKDANVLFKYDDGITNDEITVPIKWQLKCYYGITDRYDIWQTISSYNISDSIIDNEFEINQTEDEMYGYFKCPEGYHPMFIDKKRNIQGAWHQLYYEYINNTKYVVYLTDNNGLGIVTWKVINN